MHPNEFDRLIANKFDEHELPYNPANWERLSRALPEQKPKVIAFSWMRVTGIAASLLIVVASAGYLILNKTSAPAKTTTQPATFSIKSTKPWASIASTASSEEVTIPVTTEPPIPAPPRGQQVMSGIAAKAFNPVIELKNTQEEEAQIVANSTVSEEVAPAEVKEVQQKPQIVFRPTPVTENAFEEEPRTVERTGRKTNFSLTGGMNFGSMDAGYVAGVNARHSLSSKVFLEGDVAVVSNQATQASLDPSLVNSFNSGTMASKGSIETKRAGFVYLQVNPSVGYQLHKKLSVSVGGDMQKLIEDQIAEGSLMTADGEARVIPDYDLGLTGKTEFAITPKLKAGLLYREGVNNLMYGSGDYLDRRYLQVQLKYRILGR